MDAQQQNSTRLSEDIIYIIAEELLAKMPDKRRIDFTEQNCYTLFMSHSEVGTRTMIAQFAKFKRIDFAKFGQTSEIEFYKNSEKFVSFNESQTEFRGPYNVPKGMLEYIIENGKLRVNTIDTSNFLLDDHFADNIKEFGKMKNSLEAFCALFLRKQIEIPKGLNNELAIQKFRLGESAASIRSNLATILAIDAVELEFCSLNENNIIDCSQHKSSDIAHKTTKITVDCTFNFDNSPREDIEEFATNFESFASFLIRACPNLKRMEFALHSSIDSPIDFTENIHSTIKTLAAFQKSLNVGHDELQISIVFYSNCHSTIYEELPLQDHDLYKIGSAITVDGLDENMDPYTARSLELIDARGRMHKLFLKIFADTDIDSLYSEFHNLNDDYDLDDYIDRDYPDYDDYDVDDEQFYDEY